MADIHLTEYRGKKAHLDLELSQKEVLKLQGHHQELLVIATDLKGIPGSIAKRGRHEATMYSLIPKELRKGLRNGLKTQVYRIDTKKNIFLITKIRR